jgi:hypothetical protein
MQNSKPLNMLLNAGASVPYGVIFKSLLRSAGRLWDATVFSII